MRFVTDWEHGLHSMVALCARYGVSRKTGYKWIGRYEGDGLEGLRDRSRAAHHCPHRMSADVAEAICAGRRQHPSWGPDKILHWLKRQHPRMALPAPSTAGDLLARRGLVKKRRRRRHYPHPGVVLPTTSRPDDLWTSDFKGHFRTRDGVYCYPLTVADQHTRYLLGCQGRLSTQGQGVRPIFERLFREYGLPGAIRTDNGVPFATTGIHGLAQLNVWWIRLGILHQQILPACPQQNGAHERMHRTLKAATARPLQPHLAAQQRACPHQFLKGRTPASLYQPSSRPYPDSLPPIEYPGHYIPKRMTNAGTIRFKKRLLFIANSLKQQLVGLEEVDDGVWSLYFCHVSWPASMNVTAFSALEARRPQHFRGDHGMATAIIAPLRGSARCVIALGVVTAHGITRDPHAISPSVTHVSG